MGDILDGIMADNYPNWELEDEMGRDESVVVTGVVKAYTDKAVLLVVDGGEHWFPLSQMQGELDEDALWDMKDEGTEYEFTVPQWLAAKKGIVDGEE